MYSNVNFSIYFCSMTLLIILLVAAILGFVFNWLLVNLILHSVLPQKSGAIANTVVSNTRNLINIDALTQKLSSAESVEKVLPYVEQHIDYFLQHKLKEKIPALAMFVGEKTIAMIKTSLMDEIGLLLPGLLQQYMTELKSSFDVEKIVLEKLNSMDWVKVIKQQLGTYIMRFQLFGSLAGIIIGFVSYLLPYILG